MKNLQQSEESRDRRPVRTGTRYTGVKAVLLGDLTGTPSTSQPDYLQWQGIDGPQTRSQKKIYRSDERSQALILCEWGSQADNFALHEAITK